MSSLSNTFFENKWVRICLYFVSILGIGVTLANGFFKGDWPTSLSEILVPILLALYIILDVLRMREKKKEISQEEEGKIDEIGRD
ncbi:MAG: hypothetical protein AAGD28_23710 [Bacteroidota bacterium]